MNWYVLFVRGGMEEKDVYKRQPVHKDRLLRRLPITDPDLFRRGYAAAQPCSRTHSCLVDQRRSRLLK